MCRLLLRERASVCACVYGLQNELALIWHDSGPDPKQSWTRSGPFGPNHHEGIQSWRSSGPDEKTELCRYWPVVPKDRNVWARSGPNDFCYLVRTQPINSQLRVGFYLYYSRTKLIRNYFASYLLGMMLGSASLLYIFNDYSIAKLHHFSCRMPHAVANNIKKYVDLLLLKMFNVTDNAYKL